MHSSSIPILPVTVKKLDSVHPILPFLLLIAHGHIVVRDERYIFVSRTSFKTDDLDEINKERVSNLNYSTYLKDAFGLLKQNERLFVVLPRNKIV